ncbi:DsbC family protein [Leeia aquatica]|uniref:Thiol:disulfide interchange protein n=1 Tax=Leeia aquatica TaxID=2725557 RepID=A0A847SFP7_9NEIS|nr:DsbC family protein [Leeia aquatica]NLR76048.1 DsbC family protein [Leeia aquatica]
MTVSLTSLRPLQRLALLACSLPLLLLTAPALAAGKQDANLDKIKTLVTQKMPRAIVNGVYTTPLPNLYEVVVNGSTVLYVDSKVNYLIQGEMIDVQHKQSLTEQRLTSLRKAAYSELPLDLAIREVRGTGARTLVVFSDPDCPFCHQLEQNLKPMTDVTIYTLLYPIPQLHPDAARKSDLIWCQPNRLAAWRNWMDNKVLPEAAASCISPLARIAETGQRWGVDGTPAIVLPDGRIMPGAYPLAEIEKALSGQ